MAARDPQPEIPVLAGGQALVEAAERLQQLAAHHHARRRADAVAAAQLVIESAAMARQHGDRRLALHPPPQPAIDQPEIGGSALDPRALAGPPARPPTTRGIR